MLETLKRDFTVTLFGETRTITAEGWVSEGKQPTRFDARYTVAIRYRTGKHLHHGNVEVETDPVEVARLIKRPFNWEAGEGIAYRVHAYRAHGNFRSALIPVGWADKFSKEQFA